MGKKAREEIERNQGFTYGMFLEYGRDAARMARVGSRLMLVNAEYAVHGNIRDAEWIKRALEDMVLPPAFKKIWFNLWRLQCSNGRATPPL